MKRWMLLVAVVVISGASSRWENEMEGLLRKSSDAYRRGDLTAAAAFLERAQRLAPDPRLVAFNLATVRYHEARGGQHGALGEAEMLYRCCLERDDPRRSEAFLGLGNCLLLRGSQGKLDGLVLRAAIDRFTLCRREPGCSPQLALAAQYNQQRARLLLLQAPPQVDATEDPSEGEPEGDKNDPARPLGNDKKEGPRGEVVADPNQNGDPNATTRENEGPDRRTTPGKGAIPPPPDSPDAPPISAADAAGNLAGALERISADALRHRRGRSRSSSSGVRDW